MTVKDALWELFDSMPATRISGWQLFNIMRQKTGLWTYPGTILDYAREYADAAGGEFRCVDRERSVYQFEPGMKIAGAIVDRR